MKQCSNGHLYDETKSSSCPYCAGGSVNMTQPLDEKPFPSTTPLEPNYGSGNIGPTQPMDSGDKGVTMKLGETSMGILPVIGWLVVVNGEHKGVDYKVRGEKCRIGRDRRFEVNIDFDMTISSQAACAIIQFSNEENKFYIKDADGSNNVYINGKILLHSTELNDYDVIKAGTTELVFRSFCNENFNY